MVLNRMIQYGKRYLSENNIDWKTLTVIQLGFYFNYFVLSILI
jgi:hypothetical protein